MTTKEFYDRVQNDPEFAEELQQKVAAQAGSGDKDPKEVIVQLASEYGYDVDTEEITRIYEDQASELNDEELGKVAGGTFAVLISLFVTSLVSSGGLSGAITYYTGRDGTFNG